MVAFVETPGAFQRCFFVFPLGGPEVNSLFRGMRCNVSTLFLIFGASHFEEPRITRIIRLTKSE